MPHRGFNWLVCLKAPDYSLAGLNLVTPMLSATDRVSLLAFHPPATAQVDNTDRSATPSADGRGQVMRTTSAQQKRILQQCDDFRQATGRSIKVVFGSADSHSVIGPTMVNYAEDHEIDFIALTTPAGSETWVEDEDIATHLIKHSTAKVLWATTPASTDSHAEETASLSSTTVATSETTETQADSATVDPGAAPAAATVGGRLAHSAADAHTARISREGRLTYRGVYPHNTEPHAHKVAQAAAAEAHVPVPSSTSSSFSMALPLTLSDSGDLGDEFAQRLEQRFAYFSCGAETEGMSARAAAAKLSYDSGEKYEQPSDEKYDESATWGESCEDSGGATMRGEASDTWSCEHDAALQMEDDEEDERAAEAVVAQHQTSQQHQRQQQQPQPERQAHMLQWAHKWLQQQQKQQGQQQEQEHDDQQHDQQQQQQQLGAQQQQEHQQDPKNRATNFARSQSPLARYLALKNNAPAHIMFRPSHHPLSRHPSRSATTSAAAATTSASPEPRGPGAPSSRAVDVSAPFTGICGSESDEFIDAEIARRMLLAATTGTFVGNSTAGNSVGNISSPATPITSGSSKPLSAAASKQHAGESVNKQPNAAVGAKHHFAQSAPPRAAKREVGSPRTTEEKQKIAEARKRAAQEKIAVEQAAKMQLQMDADLAAHTHSITSPDQMQSADGEESEESAAQ